jgi:hypothetical protein
MVKAITAFMQHSQKFLYWRNESKKAEARKIDARDWLKDYIDVNGEPDENGSKRLYFDDAYTVDADSFAGLELRKGTPADRIDTDAAKLYIKEHNLEGLVVKMVPTYDWDELVLLNQKGVISDDDLDALFVTPEPTYSLYAIED